MFIKIPKKILFKLRKKILKIYKEVSSMSTSKKTLI